MTTIRSFAGLLLAVPLILNGQQEIPLSQSYHHVGLKLTVRYPGGWFVDQNRSVFDAISFPPSARPPQILVPENGGEITIGDPPQGVSTVAAWMEDDRIRSEDGDVITKASVDTKCCGKREITVVRSSAETGIPEGRNVICYLALDSRLLKVALLYRGQNRGAEFERVLFDLIRSIQPD